MQVYEYLMRLRLRHQAERMREGRAPDNHLPTESLTDLDRAMLKQASARISLLLKRVSYDFLGRPEPSRPVPGDQTRSALRGGSCAPLLCVSSETTTRARKLIGTEMIAGLPNGIGAVALSSP